MHCMKFSNFPTKGSRDTEWTTFFQIHQFDIDLWSCDLNINWGHLLSTGIHCTKFGNFPAQGSKDIEWTFFSSKISSLTVKVNFYHVTWKSIWVIFSLGASTVPSFATFRQMGQKILSWHCLVDILRCKTISPFFQRGG